MAFRRRRPRVNRHFKIDEVVRPDDREAYLALLREPRTTIDLAHAWLAEKGYRDFSRSAVARHRRHYLEGFSRREEIAAAGRHFAALARSGEFSADDVLSAMVASSEMHLFKALIALSGRKATLDQLGEISHLVSRMVTTRWQATELERLKGAGPAGSKPTADPPAPTPALTPEEQRERTARRICDILGEPYPRNSAGTTEAPAPPEPPAHPGEPSSN